MELFLNNRRHDIIILLCLSVEHNTMFCTLWKQYMMSNCSSPGDAVSS